ncbi:MAG: hypothetical protein HYW62_03575 [Candidatus Levybacteria bacterium]|nr:hypothetical protein [Candidatus Levybacteria bacterium]
MPSNKNNESLIAEFLMICDYAYTSEGGKLSLVGKFETIFAREFPTSHPEMFLVVGFLGQRSSQHTIKLKIIGPSGEEIIGNAPPINIVLSNDGRGNLIHRFFNLPIKQTGEYKLSLYESDRKIGETKFAALKREINQANPSKN